MPYYFSIMIWLYISYLWFLQSYVFPTNALINKSKTMSLMTSIMFFLALNQVFMLLVMQLWWWLVWARGKQHTFLPVILYWCRSNNTQITLIISFQTIILLCPTKLIVWLALFYCIFQAVVCLDDGDCKIRNGLVAAEDDSTLDTSIACDSCDKWYLLLC